MTSVPPSGGRCSQPDVDLSWFFPDPDLDYAEQARLFSLGWMYCRYCPKKDACLRVGWWEPDGLWGGLTPIEREKLRVGLQRPLPCCKECGQPIENAASPSTKYHTECRQKRRARKARENRERQRNDCPRCNTALNSPQSRSCRLCGWRARKK